MFVLAGEPGGQRVWIHETGTMTSRPKRLLGATWKAHGWFFKEVGVFTLSHVPRYRSCLSSVRQ